MLINEFIYMLITVGSRCPSGVSVISKYRVRAVFPPVLKVVFDRFVFTLESWNFNRWLVEPSDTVKHKQTAFKLEWQSAGSTERHYSHLIACPQYYHVKKIASVCLKILEVVLCTKWINFLSINFLWEVVSYFFKCLLLQQPPLLLLEAGLAS